jgi:transposase
MNTSYQHILGIDISKKHFDVALLLPDHKRKNKKFLNNHDGFLALDEWLAQFPIETIHACMEATNIYGHELAQHLYDSGYDVSIVNPVRIKGFATSELMRTKTDKQDASLIARFCQAMSPSLWTPEPQKVRELKALVLRLDALIEMRQQEVNRLDVAESILIEGISQHIASLTEQIHSLQKAIQQHIDDDPELREQKQLLLSIPGIGEKTVATVLAYFSSIHRFSHAKKLASFCGLTPRVFESGSSINQYRHMSKTGPTHLRKALFFPAMVALRFNPVLKLLQQRLTKAGKAKMVIIGAAMRKLVHLIYGVLKNRVPFDENMAIQP